MIFLLIQNINTESMMLKNDKLMVVFVVACIIWVVFSIVIFIIDRKIDRLEDSVQRILFMQEESSEKN